MNVLWHKEKPQNGAKKRKSCPGLAEEKSRHYQGIDLLLKVEYEVSWSKVHYFKLKSQEKGGKKNILDSLLKVWD